MMWSLAPTASVLALLGVACHAIELDLSSQQNIKSVASTIAFDMVSYYKGNVSGQTPGLLPGPPPNPTVINAGYFWWEAGGMFGALIDYWYYTGDTTYNEITKQGMLFQVGPNHDYQPPNQTNGLGNDDQGFWGLSAMTAAELNFSNPAPNQPQWLSLAIAVHNTQLVRFDNSCGGGLRWQAFQFLNGYNYKNSIANGCFFNIAARLAKYTGNDTYAQTAISTWDWLTNVGLIDTSYNVFDGASTVPGGTDTVGNCTVINKQQFSYNAGIYLHGAAVMYNYTSGPDQALWKTRVQGLLDQTQKIFFPNGTGFEVACEATLIHCTIDMFSLKAYLVRWMAASIKLAPFIHDQVIALLQSSARQAALQCSGSPAAFPNGRMCGLSWYKGAEWDGTSGVGQQMAALEVILGNLIVSAPEPLTGSSGGTSQGNPSAGTNNGKGTDPTALLPPSTGEKAGAGFFTAVIVLMIGGSLAWLSFPDRGGR